jgi:hypothetical protein
MKFTKYFLKVCIRLNAQGAQIFYGSLLESTALLRN